ncbi:MAG: hypothetical protein AB7S86_11705 [Hydrogenophaga sp.]|uniref:hypothetical protein n=1 Tax=Hydrogenophaga sp. TaxID=1904254 RepID=UPI003D138F1D
MQLLVGPEEDATNQCVTTDVFYGDAQVPPGTVRSTPQKAAGVDAQATVRIQASVPVNEPIVTLYVRAGCSNPFTRRYVLLADLSSEPVAASAATPSAAAAAPVRPPAVAPLASPSAPAGASSGGAASAQSPGTSTTPRASATRPATRAPSPANARPAAPPSVVRRAPAGVAAPRLQLDPVDLSPGIERDPALKLSPLMLSEPATTDEARAAAAERWKAINATPEDILRDARKLGAVEAEAAELRSAQARDQASLAELRSQLDEAKNQRYSNPLVHALGALLLISLLALLFVWRRKAQAPGSEASRAWWSSDPDDKTAADQLGEPVARNVSAPAALNEEVKDLDLNLEEDSSFDSLNPPKAGTVRSGRPPLAAEPAPAMQARDKREFSPSAIGGSRSIATEELFDVQQQADFFVSLGEDGQAIEVLRNHLAESHEPSALAYLDLFKLYHRLGRRHDYDQLRDEFNQVFNAGAPPFDHYTDAGRGLEAYETAFSRIQSLWPEPRVLDLIEQSIFRDASDDEVEVFDLEAYRELLLLHAMAKDLIKRDGSRATGSSDFHHTAVQPLKAAGRLLDGSPIAEKGAIQDVRERNTQPMDLDAMTPASSRLGLDVNLDDLSEFSAFEASLPEVDVAIEPTARAPEGEQPGDSGGNLIDFEVQDFMPPESDGTDALEGDPRKKA